jgi:zinc transport system ATP-binding protein
VTTLVEARGMAAGYAGLPALRDVDFTIRKGEIVTVVGPNGSGKSTLVKTLIGLLSPTAGQVRRAEGLTIGYVPQRLAIDATLPMTVARFLSLPVRRGRAEIAEMLRRVGVPGLEGGR